MIGKDESKALTEPKTDRLKSFLTEFKADTYAKIEEFLTIGELSQNDGASESQSRALNNIAANIFTTAYLPLNNLYYYPKLTPNKRTTFPRGVKNIRQSFSEFLTNEYSIQIQTSKLTPPLIMENHDHLRSVSRFGSCMEVPEAQKELINNGEWKIFKHCPADLNHLVNDNNSPYNYVFPRAKALALFKFLQQGIPIIYKGEEIGMDNYPFNYGEEKTNLSSCSRISQIS